MKKIALLFFVALSLFSCNKIAPDTSVQLNPASAANSLNAGNKKNTGNPSSTMRVPYGTTPDLANNTSGVSAVTGYEPLVKHLNPNTGIWDNTYDFDWYNQTLNVTIATYPVNAAYGDPVYAASIRTVNGSIQAAPYVGAAPGYPSAPAGSFMLSYIVWNPINISYTSPLTPNAHFNQALNNGVGAWVNDNLQGDWSVTGGGSFTVYDFGKFIKTNTGSGLGIAELDWAPVTFPATTTSAIVNYTNKLVFSGPLSNPTTVDFLQNGSTKAHVTFSSTKNITYAVSLSPGTYQIRFNTLYLPVDLNQTNYPYLSFVFSGTGTNVSLNTLGLTPLYTDPTYSYTTGNVNIVAGVVYSLNEYIGN